ncbi:hypothetical protein SBOR_3180 [Sclerotinia borealis F-4128]|uniref:Ribosomal protein L9 domain-containing protein n=1 Tax=Sclerotinia borealis (strain F-4128) TaxID=1432307 RepID=W9CKD5_SCLBF|nr:hypothetical protein SBOR_3180 [Sclerotinia borealis F-4128]
MRNYLYGRGFAVYATPTGSEDVGSRKTVALPDSTFGKGKTRVERAPDQEKTIRNPSGIRKLNLQKVESELLSPELSTKLLSDLIPSCIEFYETPISIATLPVKKLSPSLASSSSVSAAAISIAKPEKVSIYGSVSTTDIAVKMKTILAQDSEGKRIVFGPENIKFVQETDEQDRVKHLGTFEVDIQLKGFPDSVRKAIRINAQN